MIKDLSGKNLARLERLALTPSAPGHEKAVQKIVTDHYYKIGARKGDIFSEKNPTYSTDDLGNTYLRLPGEENLPSVAILGHADSPGFMIETVGDGGFASARPIGWKGNIDRRLWQGAPLLVLYSDGEYGSATFTTKSVHLQEYGEEDFTQFEEDLRVDLGAPGFSKEELAKLGIIPGCPVFFEPRFELMTIQGIYNGTNLDNRVGTLSLMDLAEKLIKKPKKRGDVYLVSTVSEEAEPQGAELVARNLYKIVDTAISIDCTAAVDSFHGDPTATYAKYGSSNRVDKGAVIRRNGFCNEMTDVLLGVAKRGKFSHQIEVERDPVSTDEIHFKTRGVPTGAVMVPTRSLHSNTETISTEDVQQAMNILYESVFEIAKNKVLKKHLKNQVKV